MVWILSFAHCTFLCSYNEFISRRIMYYIMKQSWQRSLFLLLLLQMHVQLMSIPLDINVQNESPANKFLKIWMCEYFNGIDCIEFETNGSRWRDVLKVCVCIWKICFEFKRFQMRNIPSWKIKCIIYFISQRIVHDSLEEIKMFACARTRAQWKESMPIRFVLEWNERFSIL